MSARDAETPRPAAMTAFTLDRDTSRRITALRSLLMLAVVGIHAEKGLLFSGVAETQAAATLFNAVCRHLFQTAVPLYFAISGYLLFLRPDKGLAAYPGFVAKRFRTIMLPFLLVNLFWLGWIVVEGSVPGIGGTTYVRERGWLNLLLGLDGLPLIYPLWFLRDLFLLALLAPVLGLALRTLPWAGLAALWLSWNFMLQEGLVLDLGGAFFFYLGGFLAVKRARLDPPAPVSLAVTALFVALTAVSVYVHIAHPGYPYKFPLWRQCVLLGVATVWFWSRPAGLGEWKWLHALAPYIFFIYLLHEPVLSYLSQWTRGVPLAGSTAAQLGYTLALAAATPLACLGLGLALKRLLPPAYSLLTGGR